MTKGGPRGCKYCQRQPLVRTSAVTKTFFEIYLRYSQKKVLVATGIWTKARDHKRLNNHCRKMQKKKIDGNAISG